LNQRPFGPQPDARPATMRPRATGSLCAASRSSSPLRPESASRHPAGRCCGCQNALLNSGAAPMGRRMVDEPEMPPVSRGMTDRWFAVDSRQFVARAGGGRRVLRPVGRIRVGCSGGSCPLPRQSAWRSDVAISSCRTQRALAVEHARPDHRARCTSRDYALRKTTCRLGLALTGAGRDHRGSAPGRLEGGRGRVAEVCEHAPSPRAFDAAGAPARTAAACARRRPASLRDASHRSSSVSIT
jgi:hypothetical protein